MKEVKKIKKLVKITDFDAPEECDLCGNEIDDVYYAHVLHFDDKTTEVICDECYKWLRDHGLLKLDC